jgi:hypothetical protein
MDAAEKSRGRQSLEALRRRLHEGCLQQTQLYGVQSQRVAVPRVHLVLVVSYLRSAFGEVAVPRRKKMP